MEKEDVVVSELFELFDNVKNEIGIVDWGIKMTTLEDGKRKPGTSFFFNLCFFQPFPLISLSLFLSPLPPVFLNIVKSHADTRNEMGVSRCPVWFPCQCCYKSSTE